MNAITLLVPPPYTQDLLDVKSTTLLHLSRIPVYRDIACEHHAPESVVLNNPPNLCTARDISAETFQTI